MIRFYGVLLTIAIAGLWFVSSAQNPGAKSGGKTIVLETLKIEGKLKRPQAALLAVERRPIFKPIALSTSSFQKDILKSVDSTVFEYPFYTGAFTVTSK